MRRLPSIYDGDTGPVYRFTMRDQGVPVSQDSIATEVYVYDHNGALLARRVGLPVSPKTDGKIDVALLGRETEWDGAGKELRLRLKIYAAVSPTGAAATNVLANPSFDTDAGADGIADSWALQGARTATWEVLSDDPYPPAIFGSTQRVKHAGLAEADFIQQNPSITLAVGDRLSVGCWHRCTGTAGAGKSNGHALFFRRNGGATSFVQLEVAERDWYFSTGSLVVDSAQSSAFMGIDSRGTTLDNRYDDAWLFKGYWRTIGVQPIRVTVRPRYRVAKSSNQIAGIGSFEQDSNADGLADGWSKANASGVTFTHEKLAANVHHGAASQKVTLANFTNKFIHTLWRGQYKANEVWRASVRVKTNGALGGSPTAGQWSLRLRTDPFQDDAAPVTGTASDFGLSLGSFTLYTADITIGADTSALRVEINLNGATGDVWLDDVQLWRLSP